MRSNAWERFVHGSRLSERTKLISKKKRMLEIIHIAYKSESQSKWWLFRSSERTKSIAKKKQMLELKLTNRDLRVSGDYFWIVMEGPNLHKKHKLSMHQNRVTFPINVGVGVALTKDANVLRTRDAAITVRHWTLKTPNFEAFIDRTHVMSEATKSGTNCWTNWSTIPIKMGWSTVFGFVTPSKTKTEK